MLPCHVADINAGQIEAYKRFLAVGLINDETSFRITAADDAHAPFPTSGAEDSFTLGAYCEGQLAGVVSFSRDGHDREKLRHKGILFRMYVGKAFRGWGIARQLIEVVIERVKKIGDIEQINLTVIATNAQAKHLYESIGFRTFGSEPKAIKWKGQYFTEDQLTLYLR